MLPVMLTVVLVATIAFLMNQEGSMGGRAVSNELEAAQARYVAEAGMQHALWQTEQQGCGPYTDLTNQPIDSHSYTTSLTSGLGGTTGYTIDVDQDSWIRSDNPVDNKGTDSQLHIRFEGGVIERPLYRYDLSAIPANASIISATARFYVSKEHPEGPVDIHLLTADWNESDVTWDSNGDEMGSAVLASIPAQPVKDVWVSVNLTPQVQAWVNGQPNYGITLNSTSEGTHGDYASIEAAQQPYLEVVVGTVASTPASLKSVGILSSGINRSITRHDLSLYQRPLQNRYMQFGADDIEDAWITASKTDWNYGGNTLMNVNEGGGPQRGILHFDLSGVLPAGALVNAATLELYATSVGGTGHVRLYGLQKDWVEGSCSGNCIGAVTWDTTDGFNTWTTPGGDADASPVAEVQAGNSNIWYSWDITAIAKQWAVGELANHGLLLKGESADMTFNSSDHSDTTTHPKLTITYTCECGVACLTPQGSGKIAMVGNYVGLSPNPLDRAKEAIIESWGFEVDIYDDNVLWLLDSDNYDAIYITSAASDGTLVDQLKYEPIGIVSELGEQNNDLGFATGAAISTGTDINILDAGHYITRPFAAGTLTIKTADSRLTVISGSAASGAQILADTGGTASLLALDEGAALGGYGVGEYAAARRVMLPLGLTSSDDWRHLNSNGLLLVQRALQWAIGAGGSTVGPIAHWELDETTGATAVDSAGGHDGTVTTPQWTNGQLDGGLSVTSEANAAAAPHNEALSLTQELTLTAWVNKNSLLSYDAVVAKASSGSDLNYYLGTWGNEVVFGFSTATDNWQGYYTSGASLTTNTWYHLAASFDNANDTVRIYLDGTLVSTQTSTLDPVTNNASVLLGNSAIGELVDGTLDDVRIYNRVLSDAEIDELASVTGPVAHWKLDETSGITAVDTEGGHNGTLINGPAWSPGRLDGALFFDGSNDHINVPHDDNLSLTTFSISAWIRPETLSGWQILVNKGTTTSAVNYYLATNDDEIGLGFYNGSWVEFNTTNADLSAKQWYHIAATFDDVTGEGKVYLDGTLLHTGTTSLSPLPNSDDLTIGKSAFGEYWPGQLDDVRIYNHVLSADDINELASIAYGPIAHWKLDETVGTAVLDSAGNHTGLLSGGTWTTGVIDGGLALNGTSDHVSVPDDDTLDLINNFTLTAWINSNQYDMYDLVLNKGDTGTDWNYYFGTYGDEITFGFYNGGYIEFNSSGADLQADTWYHIAASFENATDQVKLYLDGAEVYSGSTALDPLINAGKLYIGRSQNGAYWNGELDDIRIYDSVLSAAEIALLVVGGGGSGPEPPEFSCNGTYRDDFESIGFAGTDGSIDWSSSPWIEAGETDGASGGDVRVLNDQSDYQLRLQNKNNSLERQVDLSGANSAMLTFDYRRQALDNKNDYVLINISQDGGSYSELDRIKGAGTDGSYQSFSRDISSHISANTKVQLQSSSKLGASDEIWFDNIQIQCAP